MGNELHTSKEYGIVLQEEWRPPLPFLGCRVQTFCKSIISFLFLFKCLFRVNVCQPFLLHQCLLNLSTSYKHNIISQLIEITTSGQLRNSPSLHCFYTVVWTTRRTSGLQTSWLLIPKGFSLLFQKKWRGNWLKQIHLQTTVKMQVWEEVQKLNDDCKTLQITLYIYSFLYMTISSTVCVCIIIAFCQLFNKKIGNTCNLATSYDAKWASITKNIGRDFIVWIFVKNICFSIQLKIIRSMPLRTLKDTSIIYMARRNMCNVYFQFQSNQGGKFTCLK